MSRVTIDLKKHARDHVHYDLSRHVMVGGDPEEGPYCYQLSQVRFRDIITGGKGVRSTSRTPHDSALKRNLGNQGAIPVAPGAVGEAHKLVGNADNY